MPCVDYPKTKLVLARKSIIELSFYKTNTCLFPIPRQAAANFKIKKLKKINQIDSNSKQSDEIAYLFIVIRSPAATNPLYNTTYLCGTIIANIVGGHRNAPID
ncbi:MAG TPA: hypothetical protein VGB02_11765 [Pyrinomonadaceae bacterium]